MLVGEKALFYDYIKLVTLTQCGFNFGPTLHIAGQHFINISQCMIFDEFTFIFDFLWFI